MSSKNAQNVHNNLNNIKLEVFCHKLKQLRLDLGFKTPKAFARELGLKYTTYLNYEKNRFPPADFLFLLKHKYAQNVNIDDLFQDVSLSASKPAQKPKCIYSRASDKESRTGDMLANFSNKKTARECLEKLAEIDKIDPDKLENINFIIHAFLEGMRPQKKIVDNI